jgi:hypothetical protein
MLLHLMNAGLCLIVALAFALGLAWGLSGVATGPIFGGLL